MKIRTLALALVAVLLATDARAQVAWDAPSYMPPRPGDDIGIYLSTYRDFGLQGIWRQTGNMNLGLRLGYTDFNVDGAVVVGVETWDMLISASDATLPVDVTWTLGAGASFNGGTVLEVPVGLSIGRTFSGEGMTFQVYGHPRLGLFVFSVADNAEVDLDGLFDLGLEANLNPSWKLRLAATLGAGDAVGVGLAYRWGRGAVVR